MVFVPSSQCSLARNKQEVSSFYSSFRPDGCCCKCMQLATPWSGLVDDKHTSEAGDAEDVCADGGDSEE